MRFYYYFYIFIIWPHCMLSVSDLWQIICACCLWLWLGPPPA